MNCKKCGYRLWGTPGRECPECGTHFVPSEFEFVSNSVRYCCPHCQQDYYGTSDIGHLVPAEFDCVRCGRHIHMDEMTLFTTLGVQEEQTQVERMPWLERRKIGFFRGWMRTIGMSMVSPTRLMGLTPADSSLGQAWWFIFLTTGMFTILGTLPFMFFPLMAVGRGSGTLAVGVLALLGGMLWSTLLIICWGLWAHIVVCVTGARAGGMGRTCQALCYSASPTIMTGVPCLGFYLFPVAWLWWMVSAILMIRAGQRISGLRATAAVASFPLVTLTTTVCLVVFVAIPKFTSMTQNATSFSAAQANVRTMAGSLYSYAELHEGKGPGHASMLVVAPVGMASSLVADSLTPLNRVPLAGTNLQRFSSMMPADQEKLAQAAADALPANVVAHRLGDYVFTYHGVDFNKGDPGLWIVVLAPENVTGSVASTQPGGFGAMNVVHVGLTYGGATMIPQQSFASMLALQNTLRAASGLAPLPDPRRVTHSQPATGTAPAAVPAEATEQ